MRLFILKFDRSVEVVDVASKQTAYMVKVCPVGQIFTRELFTWWQGWHCLQRETNQWHIAKKVPEEIQLTGMIVN